MRILAFGDMHIDSSSVYSKPDKEGMSDYLTRCIKTSEWICSIIDQFCVNVGGINVVAFLGDLFESTGYIDTISLKAGVQVFENLATACRRSWGVIPIVALVGNHDKYSNAAHNLEFLRCINRRNVPSVQIINEPSMFKHPTPPYENKGILCLPYFTGDSEYIYTDMLNVKDVKVVLSHNDVVGSFLNGVMVNNGADFSTTDIPIFNGHYHNAHVIGRCHNIGSVISRNLNDASEDRKGIVVVDIDDDTGELSINRFDNPHDIPIKNIKVNTEDELCALAEIDLAGFYVNVTTSNKEIAGYLDSVLASAKGFNVKHVADRGAVINFVSDAYTPTDNLKMYLEGKMLCEDTEMDELFKRGVEYINKVSVDGAVKTSPTLTFVRIYIKDFLSIGELEHNFVSGLTFIAGKNGAGKSSFMNAIYYALVGKTLKGSKADDVVRWVEDSIGNIVDTCKSSVVELDVYVDDILYRIHRGRKGKKPVTTLYIKDGDKFEDLKIRRGSDTSKESIDLMVKSDVLLKHTSFLTAGLRDRFTELSFPDRVKLLESICNTDIYEKCYKLVSMDSTMAANKLSIEFSKESKLEKDITESLVRISDLEERIANLSVKTDTDVRVDEAQLKVKHISAEIDDLTVKSEEATKKKDEKAIQIEKMVEVWNVVNHNVNNLKSRIGALDKNSTLLEKIIADSTALAEAGCCPTCGKAIDNESKMVTDAQRDTASLIELHKERSKCTSELEALENKVYRMSTPLSQAKKELSVISDNRNGFISRIGILRDSLKRYEDVIARYKDSYDTRKQYIVEAKTLLKEVTSQLSKHEVELVSVKASVEELKHNEDLLNKLLKPFHTTGIRAMLMESTVIPFINERLKEYSSFALPCYLTSEVETKGGNINNKLDIVVNGDRSYTKCSTGQCEAIDLAMQLSIRDLAGMFGANKTNILLLDEVVSALDDETTLKFIDTLKTMGDTCIYLTSHKLFLAEYISSKMTVKNDGGVSSFLAA